MKSKQTTLPLAMITTLALVTIMSTNTYAEPIYHPDAIEFFDNLVGALGDKSSAIYAEPDWENSLWFTVDIISPNTYRIGAWNMDESDNAVEFVDYTITKTDNGYAQYGPLQEDGTMMDRTLIGNIEGEGELLAKPNPPKPKSLTLKDTRYGQGDINDNGSTCYLTPYRHWFQGTVTDDWDGSPVSYVVKPSDMYDGCTMPLITDRVDLTWKNGWYTLKATDTKLSGSLLCYTPDPNGKTQFTVKIFWK